MKRALILPAVTALLTGLVSLAALFGWLENAAWLTERIPALTLLLIAMMLGSLVSVEQRLFKVEEKVNDIALQSLERSLRNAQRSLPKSFRKLFGRFLSRWADRLNEAVHDQTVVIEPVEQFPLFYCETLRTFPKESFLATSLPSREYFWKNAQVTKVIKDFTSGKGKMTRVFFLDLNKGTKAYAEAMEIFREQVESNVTVISVSGNALPNELRQLFVVAEGLDLAWIAETANWDSPEITSLKATVSEERTENLRKDFASLRLHPSARIWEINSELNLVSSNLH